MDRSNTSLVPRARLYLETKNGLGAFGTGKGELLSAINKFGSLRKAADELCRSYRKAWSDLNITEKRLGFKLVVRERGGLTGGTMHLTTEGKILLHAWEDYYQEIAEIMNETFKKHFHYLFDQS